MGRTFGSLCSGIEAASVAFAHLGWKAAWLSEVDVPASQVLAYHYGATAPVFPLDPDAPGLKEKERKDRRNAIKAAARAQWGDRLTNWGDMTAVRAMIAMGEAEAPEIIVAGTPCQGFSIAGLRGGLNDDRSNLALEYIRIVDAVDRRRRFNGEEPCVTLWENVPGVLSDKTNAFGCLLAGLAGEDVPLVPAGRKWSNAGIVLGPRRAVAWVVKDAQYFGLAQRRKRVFVVASAREGFDPGAVLFEFDGVRRDFAPSRGAEKDLAASLTASLGGCSGKDGIEGRVVPEALVGSDLTKGFRLVSFGEYVDDELASTMQSRDYKYVTDVVAQAYAIQAGALRTNPLSGPDGMGVQEDQAYTLEARADVQRVAYAFPAEMSSTQFAIEGDLAQALAVTHNQAICVTGDIPHTLKAEGFDASEDGTGRGQSIVAVQISPTLRAGANKTGGDRPPGTDVDTCETLIPYALEVLPINTTQITSPENGSNPQWGDECFSLAAGNHPPAVALKSEGVIWAVRRLMPVECERLQGFWDDYTLNLPGGKKAADGPRYRQLGNSWAVNNVRWIGNRIEAELRRGMLSKQIERRLKIESLL